jgi:hypothetical protein
MTMPHPFITAELVRQRRAALDAESCNERLRRDLQPQRRADPECRRLAVVAQTFARQVRALMARTT